VRGGRVGLGGVDRQDEAGLGDQGHGLVRQVQVADDGVVEVLHAGAVDAHVVRAPAAAEVVAAGGQLADQVVQALVVRVDAGGGAQVGHGHVGDQVPVGEEAAGGAVEEGEAADVRGVGRVGVQVAVHGPTEEIGREQVLPAVQHDRWGDDRVERPLQAGPHGPLLRPAARAQQRVAAVGLLRQAHQVGALGVVELQGAGDGLEHAGRDAGELAALELGVVLDAHPGQRGDLAAAQAGHAAPAGGRDAGPLRGDLGAA
jgi:hypothetical protein